MIEARLRTRISDEELEGKVGKVIGPADFNMILTGPTRLLKPDGRPLAVYLPGVMQQATTPAVYETLHSLRNVRTDNRGEASGSKRLQSGSKTYAVEVPSAIVGAMDAAGYQKYCRLTAWTGRNLPEWETLQPFLQTVAGHLEQQVPERYRAQQAEAQRTEPEWVVPGTPFTTVTVNNTWPTGVHTDKGDLDAGFSTLAVVRRGEYTGGQLAFPRFRVAVDLRDGDLILMDAHEYHGNTDIVCACGVKRNGFCDACGAERISTVSYFRTNMVKCDSAEAEQQKAAELVDRRTRKNTSMTQGGV